MTTTLVRQHHRRKPAKPAAYVAKHEQLRADVEAIRRGEQWDTPARREPLLTLIFAALKRFLFGRWI
jgi:hypothetical protein